MYNLLEYSVHEVTDKLFAAIQFTIFFFFLIKYKIHTCFPFDFDFYPSLCYTRIFSIYRFSISAVITNKSGYLEEEEGGGGGSQILVSAASTTTDNIVHILHREYLFCFHVEAALIERQAFRSTE